MTNEIWIDISGYGGHYQVSNLGRVKSVARKVIYSTGVVHNVAERVLKPVPDRDGYVQVALYLDKKPKIQKVHRLVAYAFLANPEMKPDVNHIDGNKANNLLSNIEWVTKSENMIHASRVLNKPAPWTGKFGADNASSKVVSIGGVLYPSTRAAAKIIGCHPASISVAIAHNATIKGMRAHYITEVAL